MALEVLAFSSRSNLGIRSTWDRTTADLWKCSLSVRSRPPEFVAVVAAVRHSALGVFLGLWVAYRVHEPLFASSDGLEVPSCLRQAEPAVRAAPDPVRVNGMQAAVVGTFELGTGFSWNGMVIASEETMARFTGRRAGVRESALRC